MGKHAPCNNHPCTCGNCFTVFFGEYGVLLSSPVPINESMELAKYYKKTYGFDIMDAEIACVTGSAMCFTTRHNAAFWRQELQKMKGLK